jgi:uncharacterized RDD family membrane protein YckC
MTAPPQPVEPAPFGTSAAFPPPPPPPPPPSVFEPYPTSSAPQYPPPGYGAPAWTGDANAALAPFGAPLARWWQRVGSMLLDGLVLGIPFFIINLIATSIFGTERTVEIGQRYVTTKTLGGGGVILFLAFIVVQALYFACFNGQGTGQTVGNRAPGIAVRDMTTGEPIGIGRGLLRWFIRAILYAALILPGILNDLFPLWDQRNQTIADKAARSVVIRLK